jgi:hypothetical protein
LDNYKEWERAPAWTNLSVAAKHRWVDEGEMPIKSYIPQHLVHESDFTFMKMLLLNHFSDHILQLGNLLNVRLKFPEKAGMDFEQGYHQSNRHQAAPHNLQTKAQNNLFHYQELNADAAKL